MSRARRIFPLPFVLALALALSLLGCGDDVERGQVLLAIETDMAVPKDIDQVIVDVSTPQGIVHFDRMLDGTDNFTLPGTLGIAVGTDPDVTFTVTVIGALGGSPRVKRQVSTSLPPKGVRVLRVALQWLCANQGSSNEWVGSDADGGVTSTCEGSAKTCVMGLCQSFGFTPPNGLTELGASDYANDKTRTCFDALSCFAAPHEERLTFSGGSCFFEQPPGIDLSRSNFNVAVKVPAGSGDGFCGADGCVIPLDYDPLGTGAGWWQERLRVYVPPAVCDSLKALTVVWSAACSPKSGLVQVCQNGMAPIDVPDGGSDVIADASVDTRADAADSAFDARADGDARAADATDARAMVDVLDAGTDRSIPADAPQDVSVPPPAEVGPADSSIDQAEPNVTPDVSVDAADERAREAAPPDAGAPAPDVADVTAEPPSPPVDVYDAGVAVPEAEVPVDASAVDGGSDAAPEEPEAEAGPADGEADDSGEEAAVPLF